MLVTQIVVLQYGILMSVISHVKLMSKWVAILSIDSLFILFGQFFYQNQQYSIHAILVKHNDRHDKFRRTNTIIISHSCLSPYTCSSFTAIPIVSVSSTPPS